MREATAQIRKDFGIGSEQRFRSLDPGAGA